jgi:hypothetical protein
MARLDGRAGGAPSFGSGDAVATGRLFLWSEARGEWASCPPDEITWLDRRVLSGDEDLTLHRAPRCAGLRYVQHRWELFSRDTTYRVYLAPEAAGTPLLAQAVQRAACQVLPVAPARYEALPVVLAEGSWLVSVGTWVLRLRLDVPARSRAAPATPATPAGEKQLTTRAGTIIRRGSAPGADAVARVRGYFIRNATARLTMAYYYQEFIGGLAAPQTVPMTNVVIALNLSGEGAVSDYKKLLQGLIWSERGHTRDLADFLLANGLLTPADLDEARQAAADNERSGVCETARQRLQYRPRLSSVRGADSRCRGTSSLLRGQRVVMVVSGCWCARRPPSRAAPARPAAGGRGQCGRSDVPGRAATAAAWSVPPGPRRRCRPSR